MSTIRAHFLDQFRYTRDANEQIIGALAALPTLPAGALRLLSHLLRVQDVWLGRIQGADGGPAIWKTDSLPVCRARAVASHADWLAFLQACALEDFGDAVRYENSKGIVFENKLREVCGHVVNHSTHHRAQIATLVRGVGGEPPATDYICWARGSMEDSI